MAREAEGSGGKAKREKEGRNENEEKEEGVKSSEAMRMNEKVEASTSELGEAEDHFELCEGIRSN